MRRGERGSVLRLSPRPLVPARMQDEPGDESIAGLSRQGQSRGALSARCRHVFEPLIVGGQGSGEIDIGQAPALADLCARARKLFDTVMINSGQGSGADDEAGDPQGRRSIGDICKVEA